jgi:hypothetical protein
LIFYREMGICQLFEGYADDKKGLVLNSLVSAWMDDIQ